MKKTLKDIAVFQYLSPAFIVFILLLAGGVVIFEWSSGVLSVPANVIVKLIATIIFMLGLLVLFASIFSRQSKKQQKENEENESFSKFIANDVCSGLDKLGITKIYNGSGGGASYITFDQGNRIYVFYSPLNPFSHAVGYLIREGDLSKFGWKAYLTDKAKDYTPEKIVEGMRSALPILEKEIQQYKKEQAENLHQLAINKTAWADLHRN